MAARITLATLVGIVWTVAAAAQQPAKPGQKDAGKPMPMQGMMQECRKHAKEAMASIEKLTKQVEEAKKSDDPAKMRETLDQMQKSLKEMNAHMASCLKAMDRMETMMGGQQDMGGMMGPQGMGGGMGGMT